MACPTCDKTMQKPADDSFWCPCCGTIKEGMRHQSVVENPLVVGVALSLYAYNVSIQTRAEELYKHFKGNCMEMYELINLMQRHSSSIMTALPGPSAAVYLRHALNRYASEATHRVYGIEEEMKMMAG